MIEALDLTPSDQVLLISITDPELIRAVSLHVTDGLVVCLGDSDFVFAARRAAHDLENVLFHPAGPDEIPFRDGFFTVVVRGKVPGDPPVSREIQRVLAESGRIYSI